MSNTGTTLYQLELDQTDVNCGMSYVFQLADGRFIILDGGYFTPGEDDRLFGFLKQKTDGKPHISAWYFSHGHQDHVGNFIQFMPKYRDRVILDHLLYAFQPVVLPEADVDWKSSDPATVKEFYRTVEAYCQDVEKVKLHTGDTFAFGELSIDVIYTYEDLWPERVGFNNFSAVIMTTVGDQRILWLADTGSKSADFLLSLPLERLTCEMVQVAHHGIDNYESVQRVYETTGARVLLWPTPDYQLVNRRDQSVNRFLLQELGIREHFCSGFGTAALPLPYEPGMATKYGKALSFAASPESCEYQQSGGLGENPFRYLKPEPIFPVSPGPGGVQMMHGETLGDCV